MSKQVIVEVVIKDKSKVSVTDISDEVEISDLGSKIADSINERTGQDVEVIITDVAEIIEQIQED